MFFEIIRGAKKFYLCPRISKGAFCPPTLFGNYTKKRAVFVDRPFCMVKLSIFAPVIKASGYPQGVYALAYAPFLLKLHC